MDNFTLAVVIGDAAMLLAFIVLVVFDKKPSQPNIEPAKSSGKRSA